MKPRLILFELRMLGDAVMSLPFLRSALETHDVLVCCTRATEGFYEMLVPKDRILAWDPPWSPNSAAANRSSWFGPGFRAALADLRRFRAGVAVCSWADPRVHLMMALARIPARISFSVEKRNFYAHHLGWRRRQLALGRAASAFSGLLLLRPLLTRKLRRRDYLQHHVEDWHQLAQAMGLVWNPAPPWMSPPKGAFPAASEAAIRIREEAKRVWLIHPGARTANRRWPVENFLKVGQSLLKQGSGVLWVHPAEMEPVTLPGGFAGLKPGSIPELFAALGEADVVLCNDTGVAHAAAALGKKVVAIFGANIPEWFAPFGQRELVIRENVCSFRPCFDRCRMPSFICLEAVKVDRVIEKLARPSFR